MSRHTVPLARKESRPRSLTPYYLSASSLQVTLKSLFWTVVFFVTA